MLNIKNSLHNVIKNTATMQNKVGILSALAFSVFTFSSCEDSLTGSMDNASPAAVDLSTPSATINQNNIAIIAKSMVKSLNQVNPALSEDMYKISLNAHAGSMDNCQYAGTQYIEIIKHDDFSYDYDLEFLDCQDSSSDDRLLGDLSAQVMFNQNVNTNQYSIDLKSQLKQTSQLGEITVSHLDGLIEIDNDASALTFDLKVLLDGQGTFYVSNKSQLTIDNQTHQWNSGHLILTSATEEIDVYVEKDEGLYFEFADGSMQVLLWSELEAL